MSKIQNGRRLFEKVYIYIYIYRQKNGKPKLKKIYQHF